MKLGATVRVWVGRSFQSHGRCKYCRARVTWLTTDLGKALPFDSGFTVREQVTDPVKETKFDIVATSDIHDCPEKRRAKRIGQRGDARLF